MTIYETRAGEHIGHAIKGALELATAHGEPCSFQFNDVSITVTEASDPDLVLRDFHRAMEGCINGPIGPDFAAQLSAEELASDAAVRAENERRRAASQAEYDREQAAKTARLMAELGDAPMTMTGPEGAEAWATFESANTDPYGSGVVRYADKWARLMEVRMAGGVPLADIAEQAGHDADDEGITGVMYGCAVATLSKCWAHGEELRRWHNLKTQLRDEGEKANERGGVLNPALLSIGS